MEWFPHDCETKSEKWKKPNRLLYPIQRTVWRNLKTAEPRFTLSGGSCVERNSLDLLSVFDEEDLVGVLKL